MTQDEIYKITKQADKEFDGDREASEWVEYFAKLVATKKHKELYRLAEEAPVRGDARETRQNILHAIRGET
jgi:hypothetical protein